MRAHWIWLLIVIETIYIFVLSFFISFFFAFFLSLPLDPCFILATLHLDGAARSDWLIVYVYLWYSARCYWIFAVIIFSLLHIIILDWIYVCIAHIFSSLFGFFSALSLFSCLMPLRYLWEFLCFIPLFCTSPRDHVVFSANRLFGAKKNTKTKKTNAKVKKRNVCRSISVYLVRTSASAMHQSIAHNAHGMWSVSWHFFFNLLEQRKWTAMMWIAQQLLLSSNNSIFFWCACIFSFCLFVRMMKFQLECNAYLSLSPQSLPIPFPPCARCDSWCTQMV